MYAKTAAIHPSPPEGLSESVLVPYACSFFMPSSCVQNNKRQKLCRKRSELEAVHFAILLFDDADLAEEVLDVLSLVSGQLDDLSVFWMLHDRAVAVVLLQIHSYVRAQQGNCTRTFSVLCRAVVLHSN